MKLHYEMQYADGERMEDGGIQFTINRALVCTLAEFWYSSVEKVIILDMYNTLSDDGHFQRYIDLIVCTNDLHYCLIRMTANGVVTKCVYL